MGRIVISSGTRDGRRACAAAARISTTGGTATEQFAAADGGAKDATLVKRVLLSGHQSIFEHQTYFVSFEDVSVAVEQYIIESRLGSYTVKSRRYVDFTGAGYYVPQRLTAEQEEIYRGHMDSLFALYTRLMEAGAAKEDARFVLPYCFCSNFYMTMNARSLFRLCARMCCEKGEIGELGASLREQLAADWPGVYECFAPTAAPRLHAQGRISEAWQPAQPAITLTDAPADAEGTLREALAFTGREGIAFADLLRDDRARELEQLGYRIAVEDVSLACVTHFTRHRMQSILVPSPETALYGGRYIVPETLKDNPEYAAAFAESARLAEKFPEEMRVYFALAGMTVPLRIAMNARELVVFARLRTCSRAQWEIRALARSLLAQLKAKSPRLYATLGPGCIVNGKCPEGRFSCGQPPKL